MWLRYSRLSPSLTMFLCIIFKLGGGLYKAKEVTKTGLALMLCMFTTTPAITLLLCDDLQVAPLADCEAVIP